MIGWAASARDTHNMADAVQYQSGSGSASEGGHLINRCREGRMTCSGPPQRIGSSGGGEDEGGGCWAAGRHGRLMDYECAPSANERGSGPREPQPTDLEKLRRLGWGLGGHPLGTRDEALVGCLVSGVWCLASGVWRHGSWTAHRWRVRPVPRRTASDASSAEPAPDWTGQGDI